MLVFFSWQYAPLRRSGTFFTLQVNFVNINSSLSAGIRHVYRHVCVKKALFNITHNINCLSSTVPNHWRTFNPTVVSVTLMQWCSNDLTIKMQHSWTRESSTKIWQNGLVFVDHYSLLNVHVITEMCNMTKSWTSSLQNWHQISLFLTTWNTWSLLYKYRAKQHETWLAQSSIVQLPYHKTANSRKKTEKHHITYFTSFLFHVAS